MEEFEREIGIYKKHFTKFYKAQSFIVRKKIDWIIMLVRSMKIIPEKFFKRMTGTDGLWEIRVSADKGIFRIFCFFDEGNLVILLGGFQKKTQKTPKKEIQKAEKLKKEYFENKEL